MSGLLEAINAAYAQARQEAIVASIAMYDPREQDRPSETSTLDELWKPIRTALLDDRKSAIEMAADDWIDLGRKSCAKMGNYFA